MANLHDWIKGARRIEAPSAATCYLEPKTAETRASSGSNAVATGLLPEGSSDAQVAPGSKRLATGRAAENCAKSLPVAGSRPQGQNSESPTLGNNLSPGQNADVSDLERRALIGRAPDFCNPDDILAWLHERAGHHMDNDHSDPDHIAFDQLLEIWQEANPATLQEDLCAGCGKAMGSVMVLPDGATVCLRDDYRCPTTYGNGRRARAVEALAEIGVQAPDKWEL